MSRCFTFVLLAECNCSICNCCCHEDSQSIMYCCQTKRQVLGFSKKQFPVTLQIDCLLVNRLFHCNHRYVVRDLIPIDQRALRWWESAVPIPGTTRGLQHATIKACITSNPRSSGCNHRHLNSKQIKPQFQRPNYDSSNVSQNQRIKVKQ